MAELPDTVGLRRLCLIFGSPDMEFSAQAAPVQDILPWRDLYRQEMNCQLERMLGIIFTYFEVMPIVPSHVSTNRGHSVIGNFVRRSPNACPPCAYKCISTSTPAFFSAR